VVGKRLVGSHLDKSLNGITSEKRACCSKYGNNVEFWASGDEFLKENLHLIKG